MKIKTQLTATLSALALGLALSAAQAQQGYSTQDGAQGGYQGGYPGAQQAPDLDDETLETFVEAYQEVGEIQKSFSQQLEGVNDPDKARGLQEQAQQQMIEAVTDTGLTIPEYNQVVRAMQSDPELRGEIMGMM